MGITVDDVRRAILGTRGMKLKPADLLTAGPRELHVSALSGGAAATARMAFLAERVPNVIVRGFDGVKGVVIENVSKKNIFFQNFFCNQSSKKSSAVIEGASFARVLAVPGIDACNTRTNDVLALAAVLGIEAARACLENELRFVMEQHHVDLNRRHFSLLSDYMTWSGNVLGVTRHGMAKSKPGVLVMASFERTAESLFDAAIHNRSDLVRGVSEAVVTGQPVPVGTGGSFELRAPPAGQRPQKRQGPWLDSREFRRDK